MAKPQKPQDVLVTNGWYLDIPFEGINTDGLFETMDGLGLQSGIVEVVDAGTNKKYKFTDQLTDYGNLTLTRPYNGSKADQAMEALVTAMINTGIKLPVTAIKLHHGEEVFRVLFEGFSFNSATYPTFAVDGQEKFTVSYEAHCDGFVIMR